MSDDDRDKRRTILPPTGVSDQLAKPIPRVIARKPPGLIAPPMAASKTPISDPVEESWEDQSGGGGREVTAVRQRLDNESPIETVIRHGATAVNTTAEIQQQLEQVKRELAESRALNTTQNAQIIGLFTLREKNALEAERDEQHLRARTESAELALGRREREAEIDLRKEKWKAIWAWVGKSAAASGVVAAIAAAVSNLKC